MKNGIGTYTWVKVNRNGNLLTPDLHGRWKRFLIIGEDEFGLKALLIKNSHAYKLRSTELKTYNINPKYLGSTIDFIHQDWLQYPGKICQTCTQIFEYLEPNDSFLCWKCEI